MKNQSTQNNTSKFGLCAQYRGKYEIPSGNELLKTLVKLGHTVSLKLMISRFYVGCMTVICNIPLSRILQLSKITVPAK